MKQPFKGQGVERASNLVRGEDQNFMGLIPLACGLLWYRRLQRIRAA